MADMTLGDADFGDAEWLNQAKRTGGLFLDRLTVTAASEGLFDRWLASTGKLGGQRKVPRLSNDRRIIDAMLALNK